MTKRIYCALIAALALACLTAAPVSADWDADNQHQLVPAYFYPDWYSGSSSPWLRACAESNNTGTGDDTGSRIIANTGYDADGVLGGGPNTARNTDMATVIGYCHEEHGQAVLGYVDTNYGNTSLAEIKEDIDAWYDYYDGTRTGAYEWTGSSWTTPATTADMQIDGIFFDQVSNFPAASTVETGVTVGEFYRELYEYVKNNAPGDYDQIIANPGAAASTDWQLDDTGLNPTQIADEVVIFEGPDVGDPGLDDFTPPGWVGDYEGMDIAMLVYDTAQGDIDDVCADLQAHGAGQVYVTSDVMSNPWDTLPSSGYYSDVRNYCG